MSFEPAATPVAFLFVADRDRALLFYRDSLGLELVSSDDFGDFLRFGPALVRMTVMPDYRAGAHPALGWHVPDIVAAVRALRDRGVVFARYEGMGQDEHDIWTAPDGTSKVAWFADPDGNLLSLSQS